MRLNFKMNFGNLRLFVMLSHYQRLRGITNKIGEQQYFIMWDLEDCSLEEAENMLESIQVSWNLPNIFIVSDKDRSYRAYCFKIVDFKTYLRILLDTDYLDYNFFYWTVRRGKATLRTSMKQGRPKPEIVSCLFSDVPSDPIPEEPEKVIYDTGVQKRGRVIQLGRIS